MKIYVISLSSCWEKGFFTIHSAKGSRRRMVRRWWMSFGDNYNNDDNNVTIRARLEPCRWEDHEKGRGKRNGRIADLVCVSGHHSIIGMGY